MDKIKRAFKWWGLERTFVALLILLSFVNAFTHWLWLVVALWQISYLLALTEARYAGKRADDWEALAVRWKDIAGRWKAGYERERDAYDDLIENILTEAEKIGHDVSEARADFEKWKAATTG